MKLQSPTWNLRTLEVEYFCKRGGIDLFTPDQAGPIAKYGAHFNLNAAPPKGFEKWNAKL